MSGRSSSSSYSSLKEEDFELDETSIPNVVSLPSSPSSSSLSSSSSSSSSDESDRENDLKRKTAKEAFRSRDAEASRRAHDIPADLRASPEKHRTSGKYIKSVVYGGLDGIITTFAVVSSIAGARLQMGLVIIMGIANLFADGISMGMGDFLSSRAELQFEKAERKREEWECDNYLEGEKKEMVELYQTKGLSKEDSMVIVDIISKNKKVFVDFMMVDELGIMPADPNESAMKNGLVTFASFLIFGSIPIITYAITVGISGAEQTSGMDYIFMIATILTGATMFFLGALTSRFTTQTWWQAGLFMLGNGALTAAVAYVIGVLLSFLSPEAA